MNAANTHTLIPPVIPPHPGSPYDNWLNSFPLRSFLELGAYRNAPGSARGHARNVLAEWGLGQFTDAVILVVSEMITNSVNATGTVRWEAGLPPVRLWLLGGPGADGAGEILVLVWDAVAEVPLMGEAGAEDESGRGLRIVHWLSGRQWDCYLPPAPHGGKVTRTLIDRPWRDQPPHFLRVFTPEDDKGTDGQVHLEGDAELTCLCGLRASTPEELDAHFLEMFVPADRADSGGVEHKVTT